MCFSTFTYAENTSINFTTGVWKVVKLEPEANNPLKYTDTYMIFLENGILLNVEASKNKAGNIKTLIKRYKINDNQLTIMNPNEQDSIHTLYKDGELIIMTVPFGKMWLKSSPKK